MPMVLLKEMAYVRSGDKGDISNVGVLAFNKENYDILKRQITPKKVKNHYKEIVKGEVYVYEMPNINALQIVMHNALGGGATKTLRWDETGKSICLGILSMGIEVPEGFQLVMV